ncbi:MAG: hypothetical protein R8G66_17215 [Cytophagales bacterium]|nr:hypothetical protein [Cytophagales bacterium]
MPTKKPHPTIPEAIFEKYDRHIAKLPEQKRKGAKNPYTSHNGHMFSYLDPKGILCLRLGRQDLEAFLNTHQTERPVSYGAVMKEYAIVPSSLWDTDELAEYFKKSYDYICSLKPKPTKKT